MENWPGCGLSAGRDSHTDGRSKVLMSVSSSILRSGWNKGASVLVK
jgi:hypothetical protein